MRKTFGILLLQAISLAALLAQAAPAIPQVTETIPAALSTAAGWRWPLPGTPQVEAPFDKPEQQWSAGHRGLDLRSARGDQVVAPHRGRITFRSIVVDRPVLVIEHGSGFTSSLEPVTASVAVGDWVEAGARIGTVATGAHCSDRCLHWGVRLNGDYVDPMLLIRDLRPSILLPLE